jgi:hypothetical protein
MWATSPLLDEAIATLKAWGFAHKGAGGWRKQSKTGKHWASTDSAASAHTTPTQPPHTRPTQPDTRLTQARPLTSDTIVVANAFKM